MGKIPANSPLLFDIEVVDIVKAPEPPQPTGTDYSKFKVDVIEEGQGYKLQKGDTVSAHYKGQLTNGEEFDQSYKRGQPLQFKVGTGQVIKCWDEGFVGLAKGAKAVFNCPSDYAYGERAMGKIPSNSPLIFTVEVADIIPAEKPAVTEGE